MASIDTLPRIDEYLRDRLMPVEGAIPHLDGIDMFGRSIPAGVVGGDLFEYVNFAQRYDLQERIERARRLARRYLNPLPPGEPVRDCVDDHVEWMKRQPDFEPRWEREYRFAKSSEQMRVADDLQELYSTAGILLVDAQGHGIISAKIASTVHDTFHALLLAELDRYGKTTPELLENLNLRLALSMTARNALGMSERERAREIATMLYGEVRPGGHFRFANFGHPPPLVFSAKCSKLLPVNNSHMAQFLALGLELPVEHPDHNKYFALNLRQREFTSADVSEITLMHPGDILFLYTDGVYDGYSRHRHGELEEVLREHQAEPAKEICNALMKNALEQDELLRERGEEALIDDKTVFVVKRTE
jgi:serine phosphatase RsbU (regulator of sigma subunit)